MTTKRYLEQIGRIEKLIHNKQLEMNKIRELCGSISVNTEQERVQTSNISDVTGRSGTELAAISKQIDFWFKKRETIISQIDRMEDPVIYEILTYRYIQHMSVFDIMELMDRTERQIWNLLKRAHKEFEEIYGQNYLENSNMQ